VSGQLHALAALPPTHWIGGWGGPQSRSGRGGEEKNSQPLPTIIEPANSDRPVRSQPLYRLSYRGSYLYIGASRKKIL